MRPCPPSLKPGDAKSDSQNSTKAGLLLKDWSSSHPPGKRSTSSPGPRPHGVPLRLLPVRRLPVKLLAPRSTRALPVHLPMLLRIQPDRQIHCSPLETAWQPQQRDVERVGERSERQRRRRRMGRIGQVQVVAGASGGVDPRPKLRPGQRKESAPALDAGAARAAAAAAVAAHAHARDGAAVRPPAEGETPEGGRKATRNWAESDWKVARRTLELARSRAPVPAHMQYSDMFWMIVSRGLAKMVEEVGQAIGFVTSAAQGNSGN